MKILSKFHQKLYLEFKNYIQNPKVSLYSEFLKGFILAITRQRYNRLFCWDLTLLSPSDEIGGGRCLVRFEKKQVLTYKI
jgi:hypothetical protein